MQHCDVIMVDLFAVLVCLAGVAGVNMVIESRSGAKRSLITCYTCPNKTSNADCNKWAPDIACPRNHSVCKTVHSFHTQTGSSVHVSKRCAVATECTDIHVGCQDTKNPSVKECVSCCDSSYCNVEIPVNTTSAILLSSIFQSPSRSASISCSQLWILIFTTGQLLSLSLRQYR